jgi:hypothetical protein
MPFTSIHRVFTCSVFLKVITHFLPNRINQLAFTIVIVFSLRWVINFTHNIEQGFSDSFIGIPLMEFNHFKVPSIVFLFKLKSWNLIYWLTMSMSYIMLSATLLIRKCKWLTFYLFFQTFILFYISFFHWAEYQQTVVGLIELVCAPNLDKPWFREVQFSSQSTNDPYSFLS